MMFKQSIFFTLALTLLLTTSCGNSPVTFNDALVDEYQKSQMAFEEFSEKYTELAKSKSLSEISQYTDKALEQIDASIKTVTDLKYAGKNGADFKNQALSTLKAFKRAIEESQDITEESKSKNRNESRRFQDFVRYKAEVNRSTTKLIRAQQTYARENNLDIN